MSKLNSLRITDTWNDTSSQLITGITTVIDGGSTDFEIATAKSVYDFGGVVGTLQDLDSVLTSGNTSSVNIHINNTIVNNSFGTHGIILNHLVNDVFTEISQHSLKITDNITNEYVSLTTTKVSLYNGSCNMNIIQNNSQSTDINLTLPISSGTIALTSDIDVLQDLDSVLASGNTTQQHTLYTNGSIEIDIFYKSLILNDGTNFNTISRTGIILQNNSDTNSFLYDGFTINNGTKQHNIEKDKFVYFDDYNTSNYTRLYYAPTTGVGKIKIPNQTGTLALLSDINQDLDSVLTNGNTVDNSIILDNGTSHTKLQPIGILYDGTNSSIFINEDTIKFTNKSSSYNLELTQNSQSENIDVVLPDKSGTIALLSDFQFNTWVDLPANTTSSNFTTGTTGYIKTMKNNSGEIHIKYDFLYENLGSETEVVYSTITGIAFQLPIGYIPSNDLYLMKNSNINAKKPFSGQDTAPAQSTFVEIDTSGNCRFNVFNDYPTAEDIGCSGYIIFNKN